MGVGKKQEDCDNSSRYAIIEAEKFNKPEGYPSFIMNIIKEYHQPFNNFQLKGRPKNEARLRATSSTK